MVICSMSAPVKGRAPPDEELDCDVVLALAPDEPEEPPVPDDPRDPPLGFVTGGRVAPLPPPPWPPPGPVCIGGVHPV
jgi:hypothetical protein